MSLTDRSAVRVEVPDRGRDRPAWGKVGVIALIGFVIGIAWPRVAGVRLGPKAPGDGAQAAASASAAPGRASDPGAVPPTAVVTASPASATAALPPTSAAPAATASEVAPTVSVARGLVITCKTQDGESKKGKECGGSPQGLDNALVPRLRKLSACPAALGKSGKLAAVVTIDFGAGRVGVDAGKSSNVDGSAEITQCLKKELAGFTGGGIDHEHPRYTVVYNTTFTLPSGAASASATGATASASTAPVAAPQSASADPTPPPDAPATGGGQVVWEKALVRDVPKTGQIVASLPRGTKVESHGMKDNWVKIKFDKGEGWVYRAAIGK